MKSKRDLEGLDGDSDEIYQQDIITKYCRREKRLEGICLADFVAEHTITTINNEDDENETRGRQKPRVIQSVRYKLHQDPDNFYREQCLLYLPFRNEATDIEGKNHEELFNENKDMITRTREKYQCLGDELDEALVEVEKERDESDKVNEAIKQAIANELPASQRVDILVQGGAEVPT